LRITQEVYKQWQEIYGDREDAEAESANWDRTLYMLHLHIDIVEIPT